MYATVEVEDYKEYDRKTKAELLDMASQLDDLRNEWAGMEISPERDDIERRAYAISESMTAKQFRLNRSASEDIAERNYLARIDQGYEDKQLLDTNDALPTNDADWLSWKVNRFISNISYRNKAGELLLRAGRKSIKLGGNGQYINFMCYGCQHFNGSHYVGGNARQAQLILGRVLAHTYRH